MIAGNFDMDFRKGFRTVKSGRLGILAALAFAAPAIAQETAPTGSKVNVFHGDYVIVGIGALASPDYSGSDNTDGVPAAAAIGEVGGIGFKIRGPSISLDLVRDKPGARVGLRFGPQIRYFANRHGKISDPVVASLGSLDTVIQGGFRVGLSFKDVLSRKDRLSIGVSARWDISGKGSGMVIVPSSTYLLPLGRAQVIGVMTSIQFDSKKFADHNYSVSPEGSAVSGLPEFHAKGGLHEATIGLGTARDLNGDFLDGGFALVAGVKYSRLFGSASRTPITSVRGSRDQWVYVGGMSYTF
jgi:outer membrane scaffolding protein for murein synthesis (MipA/OmpV family)